METCSQCGATSNNYARDSYLPWGWSWHTIDGVSKLLCRACSDAKAEEKPNRGIPPHL